MTPHESKEREKEEWAIRKRRELEEMMARANEAERDLTNGALSDDESEAMEQAAHAQGRPLTPLEANRVLAAHRFVRDF